MIALVVIGIFALWFFIFYLPPRLNRNTLKDYLQRQNDSLKAEIEKERQLRADENTRIDSILTVIENTDFKVIQNTKYYERERLRYIDSSAAAHERYYSNRYRSDSSSN